MERAQLGLQLSVCERANVSASLELITDNVVIYIRESFNRMVIRRGVSVVYFWDSKIESICEAFDKRGVSV